MADNVSVPGGSAGPIATDEVSGVQYQRVKVNYGADGSATDVSADNPLPVVETASGAVLSTAVTVGTSATAVPASPLSGRKAVVIHKNGAAIVYLGGASVNTSNGFPIPAGATGMAISLDSSVTLYCISGSAGQDVRVLEVS